MFIGYLRDQIKGGELGGERGRYGGEEKCLRGLVGNPERKTSWKI